MPKTKPHGANMDVFANQVTYGTWASKEGASPLEESLLQLHQCTLASAASLTQEIRTKNKSYKDFKFRKRLSFTKKKLWHLIGHKKKHRGVAT